MKKDEQLFSAGMRVKIRDAEWFVRQVSPVQTGGQALHVRGITCPVQGRDQIFWTEAERDAEVADHLSAGKEWEEIKDMPSGEFKKTISETVFSGTPTERTIVYKAPFFKKCREDDYREAWEILEARG